MLKKYILILTALIVSTVFSRAQDRAKSDTTTATSTTASAMILDTSVSTQTQRDKPFSAYAAVTITGTSNNAVPFWMRSNQFGSVPVEGGSASLLGAVRRNYNRKKNGIDWSGALELRADAGKTTKFRIIEGYVAARYGKIQIKAGRSREIIGLTDSTLSSGSFSVSGNALGIPKVEISTTDFLSLPFWNKFVSVQGNFAQGWMGTYDLRGVERWGYLVNDARLQFHQKSFYVRLGRPGAKLRVYGGFNHQAMWGDEKRIVGANYKLSKLKTYEYVIFGKAYGNDTLPISKIGNQIGSIDQALEFRLPTKTMMLYHQFFYDIGGLYHLTNITDGLWGISLKANNNNDKNTFNVRKVLFEFISTKSQGGEVDSKITPSGAEDYYNNNLYYKGWSYRDENIGNPLVTSKKYMRPDLPSKETEYFSNNRIIAIHVGSEATVSNWVFLTKLTFSSNFGTYGTSPATRFGRRIIYNDPPYFERVGQFSGYLEGTRYLNKGLRLSGSLAVDNGNLIKNSFGASIRLTKTW